MTPQTTRIAVGTGTNQAAGPRTSKTIVTRRTHLEVRLFQPNIELWRHPTIDSHTTIAGVCKISIDRAPSGRAAGCGTTPARLPRAHTVPARRPRRTRRRAHGRRKTAPAMLLTKPAATAKVRTRRSPRHARCYQPGIQAQRHARHRRRLAAEGAGQLAAAVRGEARPRGGGAAGVRGAARYRAGHQEPHAGESGFLSRSLGSEAAGRRGKSALVR